MSSHRIWAFGGGGFAAGRGLRAVGLAVLMAGASAAPLLAQTAPPGPAPPPSGAPAAPAAQPQGPQAETPPAPAKDKAKPKPKPKPEADTDSEDEDATTVQEVTVNGRRSQIGAVVGDIKPEIQLTPADIASYGVSTVTELLQELGPEVRSDRGRGQGSPVILVNGRRISSFHEIENIPTEAILRVDILPEEVSLKYGYTADQRVVNIVLRRRFRATTGEVKGGGATEGGEVTGQTEADLLRLRGDNRLNMDLKYQGNSNLLESERGIDTPAQGDFSLPGNIVSATAGGEIDPALSTLAGKTVTVAGVPGSGATAAPALAAFVPTAGVPTTTNLGDYRTLVSSSQTLTFNGVWAHSTLGGIAVTLNANLSANDGVGLQGLPTLALTLPVGSPFSPFSQPVVLDRYFAGFGPLTQEANGWTGHLGATANKDWKGWRLSFTTAYDHSDSLTATQTGIDGALAQNLINMGNASFNPYAALPPNLLSELAESKARGLSDQANAQFLGNGPLMHLPAGDFYASVKFGETIQSFDSLSDRLGLATTQQLWRSDLNAQVNLDLPVLKRVFDHGWGAIGDLSLNGNFAVDQISQFGTLLTVGYGFNWTPWRPVNIIFSRTLDHLAPTVQQLGNPQITTPGVRVYDYLTGETVTVQTVSGGNPNLKEDSRDVMKLGLTVKPWSTKEFTFTANYIWSDIKNSIFAPPGSATPQIEADFPIAYERTDGVLTGVNETSENLADQSRQELRWGVNFATPIGPPPKRDPNAPRPTFRGAGGGGDGGARPAGGGGGGGGRGGFGGFGGGQQGRFQVALYHTVYFRDQVLAATGVPTLDLLNGGATGSSGGQYRHELEGQLGFTKSGFGIRTSADWKSATKVEGGTQASDLSFSQIGTLNLRLWDNFGSQPKVVKAHPWLRASRLTLEANNLFDTRQTVHDGTGTTPLAYLPGYINPTGRTVELSIRKLFF